MSRRVIASLLGVSTALCAVGVCAYVAVAPLVPKRVITVSGTGTTVDHSEASLVEALGWPALAALAVVVAVCAAPLIWRSSAAYVAAAAAMTIFSLVTWSTVGIYLLPLAALLAVTALVWPRSVPDPSPAAGANDLPESADNRNDAPDGQVLSTGESK